MYLKKKKSVDGNLFLCNYNSKTSKRRYFPALTCEMKGAIMQSINQDIKTGEFKQVYLLHGDEAYLRKSYRDKLRGALSRPDDSLNYTYFEGKGINPLEIIDLAETMPFLAEKRLIIIENSGFFKSACDSLADYISEIPETTHLVFVEGETDKRGRLYKAIKDRGRAVEMALQDETT